MLLGTLFWLLLGGEPAHARTEYLSTPVFCNAVSGFRFYDLNMQRFLNRDPIQEQGGINLYGFVGNDPSDNVDPLGLAIVAYTKLNCLGYASGKNAFIQPDPGGGKNGNGESLKDVVERMGYKCSGPTTKECKSSCDQDVMVVYVYRYKNNPKKLNPEYNDYHAIRGDCDNWTYVPAVFPKGDVRGNPQPTPDPKNPDSYWGGDGPKQRYCCKKKKNT